MELEIIGRTIDVIGKIMVAFTAIMVHHRFLEEHQVDEQVFKTMKRERYVGIVGMIMMVMGYVIEIIGKSIQA